ncbi:hypothetical protein NC651_021635 [Populus alba x Populus x berolinensis]|nr:hypothetical protein NC651_021635 [Populus alba x Populus x berolinensis]
MTSSTVLLSSSKLKYHHHHPLNSSLVIVLDIQALPTDRFQRCRRDEYVRPPVCTIERQLDPSRPLDLETSSCHTSQGNVSIDLAQQVPSVPYFLSVSPKEIFLS